MKKLLTLTFFAILTFLLLVVTYGVFQSKVIRGTSIKIAAWVVQVNDGIVSSKEKKFTIDDIVWNTSSNVLEGKAAPGIDGYFDIVIDPNNTDVSIRYDIVYDMDYLKNINTSFEVYKVEELNNNDLLLTDKDTYTGLITLDNSVSHTIRTYVKWQDIEENNESDYITGTENANFEIPVNVIVSQYTGEEIVEYNEG